MKTLILIPLLIFCYVPLFSQTWSGTNVSTTTTNTWNTSLQLTHSGWGSHHALLFNAYQSPVPVNGDLYAFGNTKHTFDASQYSSGAGAIMFLGNGGRMDFLLSDASSGANQNIAWGVPKLSIDRNGWVGIGTMIVQPNVRLSVNGKIKAEEIEVVVDVPADYVFEPGYQLMPLSEVSAYIRKNKHLPNVPAAEELINNGWNVGEMNNKVLEKVEELMLYIIRLQEQQDELQRRIKELEEKN